MVKKTKTVRKRITDLFKSIFNGVKVKARSPQVQPEKTETIEKTQMFQRRKKPPSKWVIRHNQNQAHRANKIQKRRKKNKVSRKMRKINHKKAA
ncbi:MAG: hypothetical protein KAS32_04705 [Candidatus Peribacteraceae bacterium]|nr:hypothetical protein [Candidatus Peribacteraceae bacterium]